MGRIGVALAVAGLLLATGLATWGQETPRLTFKPGIWQFDYKKNTRVRDNDVERSSESSRTLKQKIATPRSVDIFLTYFLTSHNNQEHCRYLYLTAEPNHIRAEHLCDYQLDPGPLGGTIFSTKIDLSTQNGTAFMGEIVSNQSLHGQWMMIERETVRGRWVSAHR